MLPPFKVRLTKLKSLDDFAFKKAYEPTFQTVWIPLSAFAGVDPSRLTAIRLAFDRTPSSVILLSKVGFE